MESGAASGWNEVNSTPGTRLTAIQWSPLHFPMLSSIRCPGALPSVVAGFVAVPVVAVPTSIGYGASFGGLAALLGMLNSCASNVAVVNIDNGFGAAYLASLINQIDRI